MDFNTLQQLFGRGINPGTAGDVQTKKSVGSAAPRIPRPAAPVPVGRPFNPLNPIVGPRGTSPVPNPFDLKSLVRKSLPTLAAEGALMLGDRLIPGGIPSEIRGAVEGGMLGGTVAGPAGATLGILAGADLTNERGRGAGSMTGEFERGTLKLDPLEARRLYMDQVPGPVRSMDNDADDAATYNTQTGKYTFDSSVDRSTTPTSDPRNTDLPVSAEQVAPVDPYAYQLSVYGQGRQAANSQEAMNKVRDLGLAIHQAKYPQFYRESYNPLMAATFPERYQKTADNFVVQGGIQVPSAMTNKDSRAELLQSEQEANIERLDEATSAMERLLEDLKRKGGN